MNYTYLLLLLCPIMMIGMMFMMRGGGHSHKKDDLEDLKKQNHIMAAEIEQLKGIQNK